MKIRLAKNLAVLLFALTAGTCFGALDTLYTGSNYDPENFNSEILNGGALRLQSGDGSGSISATFTRGGSGGMNFSENLVLFIDSAAGGFDRTETWSGTATPLQQAASGSLGSARSTAVFTAPPGGSFGADYVLAVGVNNNGAVYHIAPNGALEEVQTFRISPNDTQGARNYTFSFDWNSIGVNDTSARGFRFYSSYVTDTGSRRFDSMETISGIGGFGHTITFSDYRIFGVEPVPEMTNVALAVFGGLMVSGGVAVRARKYLGRRKLATAA